MRTGVASRCLPTRSTSTMRSSLASHAPGADRRTTPPAFSRSGGTIRSTAFPDRTFQQPRSTVAPVPFMSAKNCPPGIGSSGCSSTAKTFTRPLPTVAAAGSTSAANANNMATANEIFRCIFSPSGAAPTLRCQMDEGLTELLLRRDGSVTRIPRSGDIPKARGEGPRRLRQCSGMTPELVVRAAAFPRPRLSLGRNRVRCRPGLRS